MIYILAPVTDVHEQSCWKIITTSDVEGHDSGDQCEVLLVGRRGEGGGEANNMRPSGPQMTAFPFGMDHNKMFCPRDHTPSTGNFGSHTDKYTILGTGLNIKSCLRILIWTPEVPSLWS